MKNVDLNEYYSKNYNNSRENITEISDVKAPPMKLGFANKTVNIHITF